MNCDIRYQRQGRYENDLGKESRNGDEIRCRYYLTLLV